VDARFVSVAAIKGFDPIDSGDMYASGAQSQVFEGLLQYHYLKRPVELIPCLADGMPTMSEDGLTFTAKLRRDALFQDDPCFPGGKGRPVTAHDVVYCIKRFMGVPSSTGSWLLEGRLVGLDDWATRCRDELGDHFDAVNEYYPYEHPDMATMRDEEVEGLRALDDHTVQFTLTRPFPQFLYTLAMSYTAVYPREALETYGMTMHLHPVGTGPYRVREYWPPDKKILFERNPTFRGETYPTEGAPGDAEAGLLDDAGRPIPFLDRIEFVVIDAPQPRWLGFASGELDRVETEQDIWQEAMIRDTDQLKPELAERGIRISIATKADIAYFAFNMEDELLGDPAGEKGRKVRQAICLAYDQAQWVRVMRNGFWATPAFGPLPPSVQGFVDTRSPYAGRDLERAKALLVEAGYPNGEGLPPLEYELSGVSTTSRKGAEIFKQSMREIGIDVNLNGQTWDQFLNKVRQKKAQLFGMAWNADYPDAENFLQLFYGPNESPGPNNSNYQNDEYDRLYDQFAVMSMGPERDAVVEQMLKVLYEDCPWSFTDYRIQYTYLQPWLRNFKYLQFNTWAFKYYDVDRDEKARRMGVDKADER
jgi:ABC-type transport system substrate-binding protein